MLVGAQPITIQAAEVPQALAKIVIANMIFFISWVSFLSVVGTAIGLASAGLCFTTCRHNSVMQAFAFVIRLLTEAARRVIDVA
jgi:hypothetical protein